MATEDDNVNSGALGTLLFVGAFATIGIALVVTALVRAEMSDEAEKKDVGADRAFKDLVAEQTAKLSAPASYIDRGKGLVSLPIDRSMELVVSGLKKDPNSATPPPPKDAKPEEAAAPVPSNSGDPSAEAAPAPEGAAAPDAGKPAEAATHAGAEKTEAEKNAKDAKDGEKDKEKKDGENKDKEKKEAPKPKPPAAPVPAAPAPAAHPPAPPAPAPAAPAPNGQ